MAIIDALVAAGDGAAGGGAAGDGAAGDGAAGDGGAAAPASGAGEPPHAVEEGTATPVEALEAEAVGVASRLHAAAAVHGVCLSALLVARGAAGPMRLVWRCEEKAAADGSLVEELREPPPSTARAVVAAAEAEAEAEAEVEAEAVGGAPTRGVALRLRLSPRAFFQTSTAGAEVLYGAVAARVGESGSGLPSLGLPSPPPHLPSRHPVAPPPEACATPALSACSGLRRVRVYVRTRMRTHTTRSIPRPAHHAQHATPSTPRPGG